MTALIRPAVAGDAAALARIHDAIVDERVATFDTSHVPVAEAVEWLAHPPLLLAELDGAVVGYVRALSYSGRECYRGVSQFSIYVEATARGQGVGDALLRQFLRECTELGTWKLLSRVFPENGASLALLAKHGFRQVGTYRNHAQLDGVWRDVVIVERLLGDAETG